MGQSSSSNRRRQEYHQPYPAHAPPPPPPPPPYNSYPSPSRPNFITPYYNPAQPPAPAPYYYPYHPPPPSSSGGGLVSFFESLVSNSFPSSYRPNQQGNVWWTSSPPAAVPYSSFAGAPTTPPPYVEHQKAKKIKNDVNLHKDTIRLEVDEQNQDQYIVSFVYDAVVDGSITIYYFAKEGTNCSFSSIEEDIYKPRRYPFENGSGKKFCQPSGHGIDLGFFDLDDLSKPTKGDAFPLVIYAEACRPAQTNDQSVQATATHAQISLAVIDKNNQGSFQAKVIKQILWVDGERYELQEIFGLVNSSSETIADGDDDVGKECVICMTESRNTAVFPCRHLCMCSNCAKALRLQSNKCPICRQPVEKLMEINVQSSEQ